MLISECFKSKVRIRCKTGSSDTAKAREAYRKAACSFKPQRVPFLSRCRSHFINDTQPVEAVRRGAEIVLLSEI